MIHRLVIAKLNFSCRVRHAREPKLAQEQQEQLPIIIDELRVWQDDRLVLAMEGGISISEDTKIRFTHVPNGRSASASRQRTPGGHLFQNEWKVDGSGF
jgi:sulfur-oxidizing protein SoxY